MRHQFDTRSLPSHERAAEYSRSDEQSLDCGRALAALRAACPHDEFRRRARPARRSSSTTSGRATTCSRSPTTGSAATRRRRSASLVLPSAELNCLLPGRPRRPRARASGSRTRSAELEGERRDLAGTAEWITAQGGVAYLAHPVLDRREPRARSSCPTPSRASRSSTPAASSRSAAASPPCTGTSCSTRAGRATRSRATTATIPGFDSDLAWTWVRSEPTRRRACSRRSARGCFYGTHGAAHHVRRRGWRLGRGAVRPVQLGHGRLRRLERRRGPRRPPRLPLRRRDPRHDAGRARSRPRGSTCPRPPPMRESRSRTPAAAEPGRTRYGPGEPGGTPRAPSWPARPSTCS